MNNVLTELYRASRSKEALASQEEYNSANVLLGNEVEKFALLIIEECCVALHPMLRDMISRTQGVDMIMKHFSDEEQDIK